MSMLSSTNKTSLGGARRRRAVGAVFAAALAAAGVIGVAGPAHADEPGLWCTITSTGTLSAPSPVQYGQFITVEWSAKLPDCPAPILWIDGPGFGGGGENLIGRGTSRQVRAVTEGSTMTWSLYVLDTETDSRPTRQLASTTITVL
jgi:hypothetical protein